jgi:hypothetical protein
MFLAYVDDSGNSGPPPGGSLTYSLGCVLVEGKRWPQVFDELIDFRRYLRSAHGIPVRAELKANYLIRNGGPHLRANPLSEHARFRIYRGFMRLQKKLDLNVFAIVVDKHKLVQQRPGTDPRPIAWEYLLQRLERFSTNAQVPVMVVHDEGEELRIRLAARKARRAGTAGKAYGPGILTRPFKLLLDDPVPRRSDHSYFIQLADLDAYSAFRRHFPPPPRPVQIVPQLMWDQLDTARFSKVNQISGGPPGIVLTPK